MIHEGIFEASPYLLSFSIGVIVTSVFEAFMWRAAFDAVFLKDLSKKTEGV